MEIAIGIAIGLIIAALANKKHRWNKLPSKTPNDTERKRLKQVDDEMVTVILPTINNDK
jgi:uncharacterized membrane-anchored protein YhcB (DUF1043 family)